MAVLEMNRKQILYLNKLSCVELWAPHSGNCGES